MKYLKAKGFRVIPVNPGQAGKEILGEKVYASLADIEEPIDIVDIFRGSAAALPIAKEAIRIGAKVVWMQPGAENKQAAERATKAGMLVIMGVCMMKEHRSLLESMSVGVERCRKT